MTQTAGVITSKDIDYGEKLNKRHNAAISSDTDREIYEGDALPCHSLINAKFVEKVDGNRVLEVIEHVSSSAECFPTSSTRNLGVHDQIDSNSLKMKVMEAQERKKRRRKKRKLLGNSSSIEYGASPSALDIQENSAKGSPLNLSDQAPSSAHTEKITGELLSVSLAECPDGEPPCSSADLKMSLEEAEVIKSPEMDCGQELNMRYNASISSGIDREIHDGDGFCSHSLMNAEFVEDDDNCVLEVIEHLNSSGECLPASSTNNLDVHDQIDSTSISTKKMIARERKKRRRKQKKLLSSAKDFISDLASASAHTEKMMGEVISVENDSRGIALAECPDGEPASCEQEKKIKNENLKKCVDEHGSVNGAFLVDIPEKCSEQGIKDKLDVENPVLDVFSAKENLLRSTMLCKVEKVSVDASMSNSTVENGRLFIEPTSQDAMPLSSTFSEITKDISLPDIRNEVLQPAPSEGFHPGTLRKKLLVLDVNGILAALVLCVSCGYKPATVISGKAVFKRPFVDDFLQFCFERFHVGVWSSRTRRNVELFLDFLLGESKSKLLFCWDQSHCTDTGFNTVENREKPLLLKELKKLWEKHEQDLPWEKGDYNESNTLLLDDSPHKALLNPPYTAIFPKPYWYKDVDDNSLGPDGDLRLYLEGLALADNVQKYVEMNPFGQRAISETNLSWPYYLKVIGNTLCPKEQEANIFPQCQ